MVLASPNGGAAPLDPSSVDAAAKDSVSTSFLNEQKQLWQTTQPVEHFLGRADEFAAIFFPGGHGPMFDLATHGPTQALIREFASRDKIIAAVCHGPAALVNVTAAADSKELLLAGKKVTGFSNAEEAEVGLDKAMPFLLEDKLGEAVGKSGKYEKSADKWGEKVVVDGKLITGQNPASAKGLGEAVVKAVLGK
jgi:putative intracellular protease/amidase